MRKCRSPDREPFESLTLCNRTRPTVSISPVGAVARLIAISLDPEARAQIRFHAQRQIGAHVRSMAARVGGWFCDSSV